jgi:WD40 repeat protein
MNSSYFSLNIVKSFQAHEDIIWRIKQSPFVNNNNYVATCSNDRAVKIWQPYFSFNWKLILAYSNHGTNVYAFEWIDQDTLASAGVMDWKIKIWTISSGGQTKREINGRVVICMKLLNDGVHLAVGGYQEIDLYNINNGNKFASLQGHAVYVHDLVLMNSYLLASSGDDYTVKLWNITTQMIKFTLTGHASKVYGLKQITSDILASGSLDTTIKLWNTTSSQLIRTLTGHTGQIWLSLDLMDPQTLVSGSYGEDKAVKLWNWTTGECLRTIKTGEVPFMDTQTLAVIYEGK